MVAAKSLFEKWYINWSRWFFYQNNKDKWFIQMYLCKSIFVTRAGIRLGSGNLRILICKCGNVDQIIKV